MILRHLLAKFGSDTRIEIIKDRQIIYKGIIADSPAELLDPSLEVAGCTINETCLVIRVES